MRPWEADGGPDDDTLRRLVNVEHKTDREIGDRYGVTRQTVSYWRRRVGLDKARGPMLNHKDYLPWSIRGEDHGDSIAKRLREYSSMKQGKALKEEDQKRLDKFLLFLQEENVVVDYDRERGFMLRRRTRGVDKPGDIIRRPQ